MLKSMRLVIKTNGFLEIDHPSVQMLAFKRAEDGRGIIIRLWNVSVLTIKTRLRLPGRSLSSAALCTLAEKNVGPRLAHSRNSIQVKLAPQQVLTMRLMFEVSGGLFAERKTI